jgi:hypothetical protein
MRIRRAVILSEAKDLSGREHRDPSLAALAQDDHRPALRFLSERRF